MNAEPQHMLQQITPVYTLRQMQFQWEKPGVAYPTKMAVWKYDGKFLTHSPGRRMRGVRHRETKLWR